MPRASKTSASVNVELEGYEGHIENFEGGYTVAFETYTADADLTPLFAGLRDDRCQCAHWGYVVKGKVTFKTDTGDETFEAGDDEVIEETKPIIDSITFHPQAP